MLHERKPFLIGLICCDMWTRKNAIFLIVDIFKINGIISFVFIVFGRIYFVSKKLLSRSIIDHSLICGKSHVSEAAVFQICYSLDSSVLRMTDIIGNPIIGILPDTFFARVGDEDGLHVRTFSYF